MPHTIAVAGKGGVGKTTTCGMIIDYLCAKQQGPVLVVDADANSNLNEVLGVEVETSLGAIREEMAQAELKKTIPAGMTKAEYAEYKFNSALIEEDDFEIRVKSFPFKPMTPEEAILQMNLIGHTFYAFTDADSGDVCVVYKRKAGSYGLIVPEK